MELKNDSPKSSNRVLPGMPSGLTVIEPPLIMGLMVTGSKTALRLYCTHSWIEANPTGMHNIKTIMVSFNFFTNSVLSLGQKGILGKRAILFI